MAKWKHRKKPKSEIWEYKTHRGWAEIVLTTFKKGEHQLTIIGEDYEKVIREGLIFTSKEDAKKYISKLRVQIAKKLSGI